jgi:hypothetical protein
MYMVKTDFGFQKMVIELFSWLEDYGFSLIEEKSTIVKYEGRFGYVNVYHGRSSYEVGIEIGPPGEEQKSNYSMSELIRLREYEKAKNYRNPIATSEQTMRTAIFAQAEKLMMYGQRVFKGESKVWQELKQQRQNWSKEYAMDIMQSQVRQEVENYFHKKDYKRVIELLSRIEGRLTSVELKKLEYAKKKIIESKK